MGNEPAGKDRGLFTALTKHGTDMSVFEHETFMRGDILIREGTDADALYLVESGRFRVEKSGVHLADIGAGNPVGEIAFFTGEKRTADVIAARDSVVLRLKRNEYEALCRRDPDIAQATLAVLAGRLAETSRRVTADETPPPAQSIALVPAGDGTLPEGLAERLLDSLRLYCTPRAVTLDAFRDALGDASYDSGQAIAWLSDREREADCLVYVADPDDGDWTRTAIRQADQVLMVSPAGPPPAHSEIERFMFDLLPAENRRLLLVHPQRSEWVRGTDAWLESRPCFMHHHLCLSDDDDLQRLARFLCGRAVGVVCSGGGAFGSVQVGVYKAMREAGVPLDIFGGTSVGSAMAAAFSMGLDSDEIDRRTEEIFVKSGALSRLTVPRYGLLDHTEFDRYLRMSYTEGNIEDLWLPYFAVVSDLSYNTKEVMRTGPLWQAVRASCAIPAALPPFYTKEGRMLADGGMLDNMPYKTMHSLKDGPNVIIGIRRSRPQLFDVDYFALPGRAGLIRAYLLPFGKILPRAPGLMSTILRSFLVNQAARDLELKPEDLLIRPDPPDGLGFMNWERHGELYDMGYKLACETIEDPGPHAAAVSALMTLARINLERGIERPAARAEKETPEDAAARVADQSAPLDRA
ncbi:alpha/beta hydrolase [Roseovarius sp. TE539]|nr:alpha/beta hydrolase [Roseovarius sp. TE539]